MKILSYLILIVIVVVAVFYLYGASSNIDVDDYEQIVSYDNSFSAKTDRISILSYNVGWLSGMTNNKAVYRDHVLYDRNLDKIVSFFREKKPDIIAFQEIDIDSDRSYNINQVDSIAKLLNYCNAGVSVNWDKRYVPFPGYNPLRYFGKVVSGQVVISDFEIVENSFDKLIKPINAPFYFKAFYLDRLLQRTKLKIGKKELLVLNVHLEAFDRDTREQQLEYVYKEFKANMNKGPIILIGDFNSNQLGCNEDRNTFLDRFFSDDSIGSAIPDSLYLDDKLRYNTFPSDLPNEKIDFIFFAKNSIAKLGADVIQEIGEVSDHYPVYMEFVLR